MSQERKIPPPEVVEWFAASEELYHATLAEIAAGTSLPDDAESASHIAFSVAMESFKWGAPCPDWAADCVLSDWRRFEDFKCASLGEAFGIPDHRYANAKRTRLRSAFVYMRVRDLQATGVPLKDNAKGGKGALSKVGDDLRMSAKQVEKLMTDWRKLCRVTGRNPDERPKYADARPAIFDAIARALRSGE
ncbi:hypothetical protein ASD82_15140 [Rhodanobacter sp. Root179]|uniref:hypothetical protein n=1 Tax=Rhodanobacter sp. Root179 TaxID=1736482 RepID=UPI0006FD5CB8|nr:hypothetical protein [Rhodanobacter sp. Root179]KRB34868.1 hypothetical protein ASD82_15140 [Rhodanobacter sp. Root179]